MTSGTQSRPPALGAIATDTGAEIVVVTEAYTPALEEKLRGRLAHVAVEHLSLDEVFRELLGQRRAGTETPA